MLGPSLLLVCIFVFASENLLLNFFKFLLSLSLLYIKRNFIGSQDLVLVPVFFGECHDELEGHQFHASVEGKVEPLEFCTNLRVFLETAQVPWIDCKAIDVRVLEDPGSINLSHVLVMLANAKQKIWWYVVSQQMESYRSFSLLGIQMCLRSNAIEDLNARPWWLVCVLFVITMALISFHFFL